MRGPGQQQRGLLVAGITSAPRGGMAGRRSELRERDGHRVAEQMTNA